MTDGHFFILFKPYILFFFPLEKVLPNGVYITQCLVRKIESMPSSSKDFNTVRQELEPWVYSHRWRHSPK